MLIEEATTGIGESSCDLSRWLSLSCKQEMGTVLYSTLPLLSKLPSAQNLHHADTLVNHCSVSKADEEISFALRHGLWVFTWKKTNQKTLKKLPTPQQQQHYKCSTHRTTPCCDEGCNTVLCDKSSSLDVKLLNWHPFINSCLQVQWLKLIHINCKIEDSISVYRNSFSEV